MIDFEKPLTVVLQLTRVCTLWLVSYLRSGSALGYRDKL